LILIPSFDEIGGFLVMHEVDFGLVASLNVAVSWWGTIYGDAIFRPNKI
jgi:hypothetical protein